MINDYKTKLTTHKRLNQDFFNRDGKTLAKALLGKYLIRKYEDKTIITKIVETECYMGILDKAAHVYGGKKTKRTEPLYLDGGHIYVYLIYGMYHCLNISANYKNIPECILIRAIEPILGFDEISKNRFNKNYLELNTYQRKNLTNGPGKLCMALKIDKQLNNNSILDGDLSISNYYLVDNKKIYSDQKININVTKRINIDYAEECKDFLWRFYIRDNKFISTP